MTPLRPPLNGPPPELPPKPLPKPRPKPLPRAFPSARTDVGEILRTAPRHFTPQQIRILRAVCLPELHDVRDLAREIGVTEGTMKVYISRLYDELGMEAGSQRRLALYAIAHREMLGIELPAQEDFYEIPGPS